MTTSSPCATDASQQKLSRGHCLCGSVQYEVTGPLRPVIYCHCNMCRRTSGHFVAATACAREHFRLTAADTLRWYQSSPTARRGFCQNCGSSLFWDCAQTASVSIMAGSVDPPTGLVATAHIFTAEAGDYYRAMDDLPKHAHWPGRSAPPTA